MHKYKYDIEHALWDALWPVLRIPLSVNRCLLLEAIASSADSDAESAIDSRKNCTLEKCIRGKESNQSFELHSMKFHLVCKDS